MPDLRQRAVLVTGAGGFIGSHLCARLVEDGARVRAFVRYTSRNDRGALDWLPADVTQEMEVIAGDLRDAESVGRAVGDVDFVFHLGAQIAIPYSYVNPRDFFETNVLGTLNVATAVLAAGTERLVHVSSSEVYGSARTIPITEDRATVALCGEQGRCGQADRLVPALFRPAERGRAAVQHLRAAPVGAGDHPDDRHAGADGGHGAPGLAASAP
jgi:thioester reductase-like protein